VLKVLPDDRRVVVEKVNLVKRQVKPQGDRPGGTMEKEASLHISNVALYDGTAKKRIKVAYKRNDEGKRVRVDRKTGAEI
jgi:large subunit ribosomal protein L24